MSNRTFLPGHIKRLKLYEKLVERYSGVIDFYGNGINPVNDKSEALLPYYFSICIENSNINDYWTEKIADPFLAYTVPVYYGCKNIQQYFDQNSFLSINISDIEKVCSELDRIVLNTEEIYSSMYSSLCSSRSDILYKYNIFPCIISISNRFVDHNELRTKETTIYPYSQYGKSIRERYLVLKRGIYRKLSIT